MTGAPVVAEAFSQLPQSSKSSGADISVFPHSGKVPFRRHSGNEWVAALSDRFNELTALQHGWDGYNGKPVSFTCASFAAKLLERLFDNALPPPDLIPGTDGTLQFEWHINGYDIEVDVLDAYEVVAVRHELRTGAVEELELDNDFTTLAHWIGELKKAHYMPIAMPAA
jgi:hypothetical protein